MLSLLGLGFLIGLRHAFEADHAAAVATLATKSHSVAHTVRQGWYGGWVTPSPFFFLARWSSCSKRWCRKD